MSMIKIDHLTFSYPDSLSPIFEDCQLHLDSSWRLGLVGRNGRGKTTLLQLLLGKYPYEGQIQTNVAFHYFPPTIRHPDWLTSDVLKDIAPMAEDWQFLREFASLELDEDVLWRPFQTLSNGEQTKALLAAFFLDDGAFPLIDEPTNHLDAQARALVSRYLKRQKGFILVSHDRAFLDGCVDHILSINKSTIDLQAGTFSSWMDNFERQQAFEEGQHARLEKDIRKLQEASRRTAAWSNRTEASKIGQGPVDRGYIGHKSAKMMKRAKATAQRQERAIEEKSALLKNTEKAERLKLHPLSHHNDRLVELEDFSIIYSGSAPTSPLTATIFQHERIALTGKNGCGKSSLLKYISGQALPHSGVCRLASGLIISYVAQDSQTLSGDLTTFAERHGLDRTLFFTNLRKLDMDRALFERPMESFSAGQKKKVLLAKSLSESAHLYLWDEPLNYIDLYSRLQIERLLQETSLTLLFVEHDRAFQNAIATRVIEC